MPGRPKPNALRREPELRAPAPAPVHAALDRLAARWGCARQEALRRAVLLADAGQDASGAPE